MKETDDLNRRRALKTAAVLLGVLLSLSVVWLTLTYPTSSAAEVTDLGEVERDHPDTSTEESLPAPGFGPEVVM